MSNRQLTLIGVPLIVCVLALGAYFLFFHDKGATPELDTDKQAQIEKDQKKDHSQLSPHETENENKASPKENPEPVVQEPASSEEEARPSSEQKNPATEEVKTPEEETEAQPEAPRTKTFEVLIEGTIFDANGTGVSGAKVLAAQPTNKKGTGSIALSAGSGGLKSDIFDPEQAQKAFPLSIEGSTLSDQDGTFSFMARGSVLEDASHVRLALEVLKEGYRDSFSEAFRASFQDGAKDISVPLFKGCAITGKVVQAENPTLPFPNAFVTIEYIGYWDQKTVTEGFSQVEPGLEKTSHITGPDGSFRFENLPAGNFTLEVSASEESPEWARASDWQSLEDGEEGSLTLQLPSYSELTFRLAEPVEEAIQVTLKEDSGNNGNILGNVFRFMDDFEAGNTLEPDADGLYRVLGLHSGHASLHIKAQGYAHTTFPIEPQTGQNLDLGTLTLDKGFTLNGYVSGSSNAPVQDAKIYVKETFSSASMLETLTGGGLGTFDSPDVYSDEQGYFEVTSLKAGEYKLTIQAEGYAEYQEDFELKENNSQTLSIKVTLNPGGSVYGYVFLAQGLEQEESEDITVQLLQADNLMLDWVDSTGFGKESLQTEAGEDGSYRIDNIPEDDYVLIASYKNWSKRISGVQVSEGQELEIEDITLGGQADVYGQIIGGEGFPLANTKVSLVRSSRGGGIMNLFGGGDYSSKTDENGFYRIDKVPTGSYQLYLESDGIGPSRSRLKNRLVEVPESGEVEKNLDLSELEGDGIQGGITLDGAPFFDQGILLKKGSGMANFRQIGLESESAAFSLSGLSPGDYHFILSKSQNSFAYLDFSVKKNQGVVQFDHDFRSASIQGKVNASDPSINFGLVQVQMAPAWVEEKLSGTFLAQMINESTRCDENGSFHFETVVEGVYTLNAKLEGYAPASHSQMIIGEAQVSLNFEGRGGELEIEVTAIEGTDPAAGSGDDVFGAFMPSFVELIDADGKKLSLSQEESMVMGLGVGTIIKLEALTPGVYTLRLLSSNKTLFSTELEILNGETTKREITLHYGSIIEVTIENEELDAVSVQTAKVEIFDANGKPYSLDINDLLKAFFPGTPSKTLSFKPLEAGSYRIAITVEGYQPFELSVDVEASSLVKETIVLTQ